MFTSAVWYRNVQCTMFDHVCNCVGVRENNRKPGFVTRFDVFDLKFNHFWENQLSSIPTRCGEAKAQTIHTKTIVKPIPAALLVSACYGPGHLCCSTHLREEWHVSPRKRDKRNPGWPTFQAPLTGWHDCGESLRSTGHTAGNGCIEYMEPFLETCG